MVSQSPDRSPFVQRKPPTLEGAPPGWPSEASWEDQLAEIAAGCSSLIGLDSSSVQTKLTELANTSCGRVVVNGPAIACLWRVAAASTLGLVAAVGKEGGTVNIILSAMMAVDILSDPEFEMQEAGSGLAVSPALLAIRDLCQPAAASR